MLESKEINRTICHQIRELLQRRTVDRRCPLGAVLNFPKIQRAVSAHSAQLGSSNCGGMKPKKLLLFSHPIFQVDTMSF